MREEWTSRLTTFQHPMPLKDLTCTQYQTVLYILSIIYWTHALSHTLNAIHNSFKFTDANINSG